jgi:hypothetical protein
MNSCQQSIATYKNLDGITGSGTWRLDTLTDSATGITYKIYSFTGGTNGVSLTTNSNWYFLCIGGGGNGGDSFGRGGGGGGAGGYLEGSFTNVDGKISINTNVNISTKNSSITGDISVTSYAGGKGAVTSSTANNNRVTNGGNGGSGGGGTQGTAGSYGNGTSGQGYNGCNPTNNGRAGGGGGGISGNNNATARATGTNGKRCDLVGISLLYTDYYCAGGGGGANITGQTLPSLIGGSDGAGGDGAYNANGKNATTYGSGGGGAGGANKSGGLGYQGIIVIAFEI